MLCESILKDILHKESVALSGIKENQAENRGREILSEANSISGKVPLTPTVTIWHLPSCFSRAHLNSGLTSPSASLPLSFHPSPQGVVPVGHQLPGCETQQPGSVGDQTGNGAGKQFLGGAVPKEGLLHSRRVGLKD